MVDDPRRLADGLPGRAAPLAAISAVLDAASSGRRGLVVVEGEAGIGKTSLVRHALAARRTITVWAAGDEAEADVDLGVVEQLARDAPLGAEARAALLGTFGTDALVVGSALVQLVDGLDLDPDRPLVVVVDEAHWADVASLQALTFATRRVGRDPVVLCLIIRTGRVQLPSGLARLIDDEGTHVVLEGLDRDAVRVVAEQVTGTPVGAAAADRLRDHTGGNPLHLRTLLDEVPAEAVNAMGALPAPRSYATWVRSRLEAAGPHGAALAAAVAVLGDPAPLATAARVARVDDAGGIVDEAVALGLLRVERGPQAIEVSVAVANPLVRAAILEELGVGRRAELHRRAADEVDGLAGLRHRLAGALGPDEDLWKAACEEAGREADRGAHGTAAALLRSAMVVAPDDSARALTLQEAVDQLLLAGRVEEAAALAPAVQATLPSARRHYVQARLAYVIGPRRMAREHLARAWEALGGSDPHLGAPLVDPEDRNLAGRVAAMLGTVGVDRADGEAALAWCQAAMALDPEQAARASTAHMMAGAWALTGRYEEGLADLDRLCAAVDSSAGAGVAAVADAHSARGLLRLWSHDLPGAVADLEASLAAGAHAGSFVARESARAYLAEARYRQGRWDDAVLLAELSASIVDDTDQVWMAAIPHATAARPRAARGEDVGDHLALASASADLVGGGVAAGFVLVATLEVDACRRDVDGALAAGAALARSRRAVDERIAPWRATYVEALVAAGRLDEAAEVLEGLAVTGTALGRTDRARAEVALAAARGEHERVDAVAAVALAEDPEEVGPYPRARLELVVGRAWRRRGERRQAADVLRAALERFRAIGAVPWVEQVDREVTASGLRPTRRSARVGHDLTPQEQAVAQLVARGLTNREVATELVVSAKTVEHHLSRVYAKLGLRSRTELARTLAGGS